MLHPSRKFTPKGQVPLPNYSRQLQKQTERPQARNKLHETQPRRHLPWGTSWSITRSLDQAADLFAFLWLVFCASSSLLVNTKGKTQGHSSLYNKDCTWQGTKYHHPLKGSSQTRALLLLFFFFLFLLPWFSVVPIILHTIRRHLC